MADETFDLLTQPWVRVRRGPEVSDVSLLESFAKAHEITGLAGEVPTQDAAVLRLMLAVLHRAVDRPGEVIDLWSDLWSQQTLPMDLLTDYLGEFAHRFDLLDDWAPFGQVAGLTASKTSGLVKVIADVPDGEPFFTSRAGAELNRMPYAEAARWVIHIHAFDVSGIKTGAIGDDRVKGGRGYPIGTGWAGRCGLVILEGENLRETLLLNLVLRKQEFDDEPDLPVWERPPLGAGVERRHPEPVGPADIMTWPSRRLLLHQGDGAVVDVLLSNGDPIHQRNRQGVETMAAFRRSPNQEKVHGVPTYMPRPHDPGRALWRGLAGLLVQVQRGTSAGTDSDAELAPANVRQLADLVMAGVLAPDHPIRFRAVGMNYGTQDASIAAIYDDALVMAPVVTSHDGLRATVLSAGSVAELGVRAVGDLAANLALAAGREGEGPRVAAREDAFFQVGREFGAWVAQLDSSSDIDAAAAVWQRRVYDVLTPLGQRLVDDAGQAAWVGRDVRRGQATRRIDSALAWIWFGGALRQALPLAAAPSNPEQKLDQEEDKR